MYSDYERIKKILEKCYNKGFHEGANFVPCHGDGEDDLLEEMVELTNFLSIEFGGTGDIVSICGVEL